MGKIQLWAQYKNQAANKNFGEDDWTLVEEFEDDSDGAMDAFIKRAELQRADTVTDTFFTKHVLIGIEVRDL